MSSLYGKTCDRILYDEIAKSSAPKPYLRLRDLGTGKFSIVRVMPYQKFGSEVVATDLTRADAERLINITKEK
jgi:hypothetical protein